MLVKITNGQVEKFPYSIEEFRKSHSNISFPKNISAETLESYGVFNVKETEPLVVDKETHIRSYTIKLIDGVWTQVWTVKQLEAEAAAANVRSHRDRLLAKSDWTVTKAFETNTPIASEWSIYRQALRDITAQDGFPWNVTWPVQPE